MKKCEVGYEGSVWDEEVPVRARKATLEVFAVDESASVQVSELLPCSDVCFVWFSCVAAR